jgi:hypothetical protein
VRASLPPRSAVPDGPASRGLKHKIQMGAYQGLHPPPRPPGLRHAAASSAYALAKCKARVVSWLVGVNRVADARGDGTCVP